MTARGSSRLMVVVASALVLLGTAVAVGQNQDGSIVGWGSQVVGVDLGRDFAAVAAGDNHSLGLKADHRGDLNCDGFVDFKDINPFVRLLTQP